jgi:outer membrane protein assembly factor BamB
MLLTLGLLVLLVGDGGTSGKPGAPPNALDVAWSFRTPVRALDVSDVPAPLSDGMLAVPHGRTVSVVDTRNGRLLSTLRSSADEFTPVGFSGGVVLAVEERYGRMDSLNAYDPATGRALWRRTASPDARRGEDGVWLGKTPYLPAPGPVVEAAGGRLVGLAPRTGAVRWEKRTSALTPCDEPPPGAPRSSTPSASPYNVSMTARYLVLLSGCPGLTAHLEVMDPANGDTVWKRPLGRWRESIRLSAVRNMVGVNVDHRLRLFTESGEERLRREGSKPGSRTSELWPLGESRGVVYLSEAHHAAEPDSPSMGRRTLHAVRADTGEHLWKRSQGDATGEELEGDLIVGDAGAAGGYAGNLRWSVGDPRLQGPGASTLTDVAGRRSARVPWPVAGTYVGMSGRLLIVRSEERDGTRYTALRPAHRAADAERPVALGGAKPADWPDACGLISTRFLSELASDYVKLPAPSGRRVLGTRLPRPSGCRFATESGPESDFFSVTVRWVAPDPQAARTYATSALPWGCNPWLGGGCVVAEITRPSPGGYLYTHTTGLEQFPVASALVVRGRYVFGIRGAVNEREGLPLVRRVASHLARQTGP